MAYTLHIAAPESCLSLVKLKAPGISWGSTIRDPHTAGCGGGTRYRYVQVLQATAAGSHAGCSTRALAPVARPAPCTKKQEVPRRPAHRPIDPRRPTQSHVRSVKRCEAPPSRNGVLVLDVATPAWRWLLGLGVAAQPVCIYPLLPCRQSDRSCCCVLRTRTRTRKHTPASTCLAASCGSVIATVPP